MKKSLFFQINGKAFFLLGNHQELVKKIVFINGRCSLLMVGSGYWMSNVTHGAHVLCAK